MASIKRKEAREMLFTLLFETEFKKDEQKALEPALDNACKALELLLDNQIDKAMNQFNS